MFIPQSQHLSARQIATDLFMKRLRKMEPVSHAIPPVKLVDKGTRNGTCNISRCNNTNAIHYNRVMEKYYCTPCARKLNANMTHDGVALCSWPKKEHIDSETGLLLPNAPVDYFPKAGR